MLLPVMVMLPVPALMLVLEIRTPLNPPVAVPVRLIVPEPEVVIGPADSSKMPSPLVLAVGLPKPRQVILPPAALTYWPDPVK